MTISIKQILFFISCLILCSLSNQSTLQAQEVNWMTWEEAMEKMEVEKRKIFVEVYTDWCTWCKKMDETTLQDLNVVSYLNDFYYPVKLNAQRKEPIVFQEETYEYIENGNSSYHEFAYQIMNGKMKYPTIVFLDEASQVIQSIPGYRTTFELELFMAYFGEDNHQKQPWSRFKREQSYLKRNNNSLQSPFKRNNSLQLSIGNNRW